MMAGRPKSKHPLRTEKIYICITRVEKDALVKAADAADVPLAQWVRSVCREAAKWNLDQERANEMIRRVNGEADAIR